MKWYFVLLLFLNNDVSGSLDTQQLQFRFPIILFCSQRAHSFHWVCLLNVILHRLLSTIIQRNGGDSEFCENAEKKMKLEDNSKLNILARHTYLTRMNGLIFISCAMVVGIVAWPSALIFCKWKQHSVLIVVALHWYSCIKISNISKLKNAPVHSLSVLHRSFITMLTNILFISTSFSSRFSKSSSKIMYYKQMMSEWNIPESWPKRRWYLDFVVPQTERTWD